MSQTSFSAFSLRTLFTLLLYCAIHPLVAQNSQFGLLYGAGVKMNVTGFLSPVLTFKISQPQVTNIYGISYTQRIKKQKFEVELFYVNKGSYFSYYEEHSGRTYLSYESKPSIVLPINYIKETKKVDFYIGPTIALAFGGYTHTGRYHAVAKRSYYGLFVDRFIIGLQAKAEVMILENKIFKLGLQPRLSVDFSSRGWSSATMGVKLTRNKRDK